jgi:hypothetical protein
LWNSEFYRYVDAEPGDEVTIENVVDRLGSLSASRCNISTELEFIASDRPIDGEMIILRPILKAVFQQGPLMAPEIFRALARPHRYLQL